MKRTAYLLLAAVIILPVCLRGVSGVGEVIEQSDSSKFRELCSSALFSLSKEEKKSLLEAARRQIEQRQLNITNFTLKDAGRLALGIPATLQGVPAVLFGLGVAAYGCITDDDEERIGCAIAAPVALLFGTIWSYLGIENIAKVVTHFDNRVKYDRALAIEAMIKRIKAKQIKPVEQEIDTDADKL
jgi:hypothetical protein